MPLYEITESGLQSYERIGTPELYEGDLHDLAWNNLEEVIGEPMFPVARGIQVQGGGKPDIIALDRFGHVSVMELKRDVERKHRVSNQARIDGPGTRQA